MSKIDWRKLIFAVVVCEAAGIIGSIFTADSVSGWYMTLAKPALNPPGWVFGPVWTTLYFLMGISAYIIWQKADKTPGAKRALRIFALQLALNAAWSLVFFGLQNPGLAFLNIALMWLAIVWTMTVFIKISRTAAWLLLPYLLWVSFASYLNYSIWVLN